MTDSTAKQLQVLQNSCLRICTKADKKTPIAELHKIAGVPKLAARRKVHTCNFVKKGTEGLLSNGVNQMFEHVTKTNNVTTRADVNGSLKVQRCRLKISEGNIAVRGAGYVNELPTHMRTERDIDKFIQSIKGHYYGT